MRCGIATIRVGRGVGVAATGRSLEDVARWEGAMCTLGYGACGYGTTSGAPGGDRGLAVESKIVASWQMARSWSWPSVSKGVAGDGFAIVSIKLQAACWASSAEDVFWHDKIVQKNLTVLVMRLAAMDVM